MVESDPLHRVGGEEGIPLVPAAGPAPSLGGDLSSPPGGKHRWQRWPEVLVETLCRMAAMEVPLERMAAILAKRPGAVRRQLSRRHTKERIEALKGQQVLDEVNQHFGLRAMLPKARAVLEGGMETGNTKERSQIAQWLHEATIAKPAVRHELKIQGRIEHDLAPLFEQMGEHLKALRASHSERDPLARVQIGTAKLVRALPETTE